LRHSGCWWEGRWRATPSHPSRAISTTDGQTFSATAGIHWYAWIIDVNRTFSPAVWNSPAAYMTALLHFQALSAFCETMAAPGCLLPLPTHHAAILSCYASAFDATMRRRLTATAAHTSGTRTTDKQASVPTWRLFSHIVRCLLKIYTVDNYHHLDDRHVMLPYRVTISTLHRTSTKKKRRLQIPSCRLSGTIVYA